MARTGNNDVPASIASILNAGYAYGVEFVELGLGDEEEARNAVGRNERGLHGNAIVSAASLDHVMAVRLGESGGWFDAGSVQPRIGGRMAVVATMRVDGRPVQLASTHLENRGDGQCRAEQLDLLLDAVDEREPGGPAVIGGDFNTLGAAFEDFLDRRHVEKLRAVDPSHFSWPVSAEPLFEVAAARGFSWVDANVSAPTTTHGPDGLPDYVPVKIDWFLVRGLEARRPTVIPALGARGRELSDHQAIAVSVRLPASG
jgi:endonuclease/exonuclease/phosphatase family metal-dependent hydrolase